MRLLRSGLCNRPNCQTNPGQTRFPRLFHERLKHLLRENTTSSLIRSRNRIANGTALFRLFRARKQLLQRYERTLFDRVITFLDFV